MCYACYAYAAPQALGAPARVDRWLSAVAEAGVEFCEAKASTVWAS